MAHYVCPESNKRKRKNEEEKKNEEKKDEKMRSMRYMRDRDFGVGQKKSGWIGLGLLELC